jgi:hypothetical protein
VIRLWSSVELIRGGRPAIASQATRLTITYWSVHNWDVKTIDQLPLRRATAIYGLLFLVHNADHARRGIDASPEPVVWIGTAAAMLTSAIVMIVVLRHQFAPLFCAASGAAIAVGVSFSHLLPKWGPLSDPLPGGNVDAFTWIAVLGEILGAAYLGYVGWRIVRSQSPAQAGAAS